VRRSEKTMTEEQVSAMARGGGEVLPGNEMRPGSDVKPVARGRCSGWRRSKRQPDDLRGQIDKVRQALSQDSGREDAGGRQREREQP
jgi:hypothetical protein